MDLHHLLLAGFAGALTNFGRRARVRARYWAVVVASVPVAERGVIGVLSLAALTMTVRVEVDVRPTGSLRVAGLLVSITTGSSAPPSTKV